MSTGNSNNVSPSASPGVGPSNAPKYGTLVPNRVFVGGISPHTTEAELHQLFSAYGNVKATKIIQDRAGVSKGYGFVTFETEDEARRLQNEGDNIIFKDRKLNIAPAIKKQPFSRMFDPSTASPTGTVLFHNGVPYTYQNGMAVFPSQEYGSYPAQPQYPLVYSQPVMLPQQNLPYQTNQAQWTQSSPHWRWTAPIGYGPQPSSGHQYVYAHSMSASQSPGVQVITIPQQPTPPSAGEFYLSQPPPVYHHHQDPQAAAAAAAAAAADHEYQQEEKSESDWSDDTASPEAAAPPSAGAGDVQPPSCVSTSPEASVDGDCRSACSSQPCQDATPAAKSATKPPKYTILAPHASQMYMTPSYVPHYHIWAPYYTLQTSAAAAGRPATKHCPRHGRAPPPPPLPPMSLPPPPVSASSAAAVARGATCWLHQPSPLPPPSMPLSPFPRCSPVLTNPAASANPSLCAGSQLQRVRYASPCKQPTMRGGYSCAPRLAAGGRGKQPDLGGAGDAPPLRAAEMAPMTPPPTPGRGDQPAKVDTASTRLQSMAL